MSEYKKLFKGKKILVTGGTGSIGREIVKGILQYEPKVIRIFSRDETKQFELQDELREHKSKLRYLIGDVRDLHRLRRAVEDIDIIIHAAALKHVPSCEYNPFEAVKTNVIGTQNIVDVALEADVETVVGVSTDKATNPVNTMGASKLLSERLLSSAEVFRGTKKTTFISVRFGNVLGTRGSIVPHLKNQIARGGPVTLTDPKMTRFMMSIPDAVNLIFEAMRMRQGGEVFIFKMPVVKVSDLVSAMVEEYAPKSGFKPEDIKIETIGARPGEKIHEELMTREEAEFAYETDKMFILAPRLHVYHGEAGGYEGAKKTTLKTYASDAGPFLTKKEIRETFFSEEN